MSGSSFSHLGVKFICPANGGKDFRARAVSTRALRDGGGLGPRNILAGEAEEEEEEEEEVWQHGQLARYKRPGGASDTGGGQWAMGKWAMGKWAMGKWANGQMGKKTARQRAGPETRTGIRRCRTGTGETGNGSDYSSYSPLPSLTGGL